MIVVQIIGGLGNQLFQFAAGQALANRLGCELRLDVRAYNRVREHHLSLSHFAVNTQTAAVEDLPPKGFARLAGRLGIRRNDPGLTPYREASLGYDAGFETIDDGTLLQGYWQSERYFSSCPALIREKFRIITPPTRQNQDMADEIRACQAISIHVRRGDYVSNPKFNATHGTCSLDYYRNAADHIASGLGGEPIFYVFSDDPDWVRENLTLPYVTRYVCHNGPEHNYEDLRLMQNCRHHIIANSSFSWWGAWLNPDPEKIVVAPKRWFADPSRDNPDILPEDWVAM